MGYRARYSYYLFLYPYNGHINRAIDAVTRMQVTSRWFAIDPDRIAK